MIKQCVMVVVCVIGLAQGAWAADWSAVAPVVKASAVEVASEGGSCTGFVIDDERDLVLTAAHCFGQTMYADGLKAEVKSRDAKVDLLVLYVKDLDRPALKLAKRNPLVGEEVASFGWGYALEQPLFRVTHVSARDVALERSHYIGVDTAFVPGQSGGPVINPAGEVVMIVQLGNDVAGFGVGAETIDDKVGRFFAKK